MEWQDDVDEEERGLDKAFTLIREAPAALPLKASKAAKAAPAAGATRDLQLGAFHELFKGEAQEQRLARATAAQRCWDCLAGSIQETLEGADAPVFQALLSFAQQSHQAPSAASAAATAAFPDYAGCQRLPTGLVLAGGVNSADHCHTFPNLAAYLRSQGCYVALLQPHTFGRVPGDAIGETLRQMSGLAESRAEHMAALQQWYRDETAAGAAAPAPAAEEEQAEAAAAVGSKPEVRHLRQRAPAGGPPAASAEQLANRQRPLVVIVEGTESVDCHCLRDFILTASEGYQEVPLTLVLGLTTTASALHGMLSWDVTDRCMQTQHFKLASAMTRLDSLVQQVLLGGSGRWPGLLFSQAIVSQLTDSFLNHHYSTGCISQGLRVAALNHFMSQPTSFLAAAAIDGRGELEAACASLAPAALAEVKRQLKVRSAADVAGCIQEALAGWSRWALGVHWLVLAAEAVGLRGQDYRPWKLHEAVLCSDFASKQLKPLLERIQPLLAKLPAQAVAGLAAQLAARAAAVWGGAEAAAEELGQLAELAEFVEEQQREEEQQEQQCAAAGAEPGEEAAAAGDVADGGKQGKNKRDRFHSSQSRKAALLQLATQPAAGKGSKRKSGGASAAAAAQRAKERAPGARLSAWLAPALRALMGTPPTKLHGAVVFTCRDASSLDCLTAEPRSALHMALTQPHTFLPGLAADLGFTAAQEDACLAYRLFDQDPNCVNLADWFEAFAAVHEGGLAGTDAAAAGTSAAGKRKRAAVKQSKQQRKGKAAAGEAAEGGAAGGSGDAEAERKAQAREVAARFSQATAELQYLGLVKPAKKRRGDYVQRLVHMPAAE